MLRDFFTFLRHCRTHIRHVQFVRQNFASFTVHWFAKFAYEINYRTNIVNYPGRYGRIVLKLRVEGAAAQGPAILEAPRLSQD